MATKAQVAANRRNAKKSTGPRTAEGKEAVSQNAFKHGLFVKKAVVRDESQEEYDAHREALMAELLPVGAMESFLAERVVNLSWRIIRAERMQNQSVDYLGMEEFSDYMRDRYRRIYRAANGISYGKMDVPPDHLLLGRLATRDWSNCKVLDKMLMYERRLESSLYRARAELLKQQEKRKAAEKAPATSTPTDDKTNLKKQTQFAPAVMGTNPALPKDYGETRSPGREPNKANRSQFKTASQRGTTSEATQSLGAIVR
jgi:hypothetical protein